MQFDQSSDDEQAHYIQVDNWRRGAIKWTSSTTVSRSVPFCIMANSSETNSTKSIASGKAASLKKSVQKGAKAIARPFKKLKKTISTSAALMCSICSRSSTTTLPISDNERVSHGDESNTDGER